MLIKHEKHLLCCLAILMVNVLTARSATLENANTTHSNSAEIIHQMSANEPREAIIPILASAPEDLPYFPEAPDFPHVRLPQNDESDTQDDFDGDTKPVGRSSRSSPSNSDYEYNNDDMQLKSDDFLNDHKPVRDRNKFRNEKPAQRLEKFYRDRQMRNEDSAFYNDKQDDNFDDNKQNYKKSKSKKKPKKLYKAIERVYFYPRDEDDTAPNKNKKAMNNLKSYVPEDPYPTMNYDNHEIHHDEPIRHEDPIRHDEPIRHEDRIRHDDPIKHEDYSIRHDEPIKHDDHSIRREDYIQNDEPMHNEEPEPVFTERKRRNPRSQKVHIDHGSDGNYRISRGGNHDDGTQALIANDAKEFGKEAVDEANRFEKFLENLKTFAANSGEYDSPREKEQQRHDRHDFNIQDDSPEGQDFHDVNAPMFHDTTIDHSDQEDRTKEYDQIGHYGRPNDYNREKMSYEAQSDKNNKEVKKIGGGHKYHKDRRRAKKPQISDKAFEQRRHEVASLIDEEPDEADYLSNSDVVSQLKKSEHKYNTGIDPIYSSQRDFDEVKRLEKMIETVALLNKQKEKRASNNHDQHEISESKVKKVEKKAEKISKKKNVN